MRARIWACVVTSRAVVGSSAISRSGLFSNAMAIMTRWRMPPDSSCGYDFQPGLRLGDADRRQHARGERSQARSCGTRSCSRMASAICSPTLITGLREVIGSWKIMAMSRPRIWRISPPLIVSRSRPLNRTSPDSSRVFAVRQADHRQARDRLAGTGLADDAQHPPALDAERHAVHRVHEPVRGTELHLQVLHFQQRHASPNDFASRNLAKDAKQTQQTVLCVLAPFA